ncbi:MAG TPA: carboxymuconolactone decarboxylase family protein [Nocardioides sp.]|uniref:carboxymuconolactone decarboxylase family protein n=1 Tax=Nocardioides sp. TaxID=35761 RepID=UPI002E3353C2|nr:carboxymuconolactone decarboxylase family protein [Nocardioides sp.]HEX5089934.1 carboxymuconolactone decarboxylase family protein [Nocardioides sp.]
MEPRINFTDNEVGGKIAKRLFNVNLAIEQSRLPRTVRDLVSLRASQINGCGWCVDIHTKEAAGAGEDDVRIHLVAAWRHSSVFTEAERAALALTEEGTRLADGAGVSDETWARVREHFDEEQLTALVSLIALINATNRLGVISGYAGGSYQPGTMAAQAG